MQLPEVKQLLLGYKQTTPRMHDFIVTTTKLPINLSVFISILQVGKFELEYFECVIKY